MLTLQIYQQHMIINPVGGSPICVFANCHLTFFQTGHGSNFFGYLSSYGDINMRKEAWDLSSIEINYNHLSSANKHAT